MFDSLFPLWLTILAFCIAVLIQVFATAFLLFAVFRIFEIKGRRFSKMLISASIAVVSYVIFQYIVTWFLDNVVGRDSVNSTGGGVISVLVVFFVWLIINILSVRSVFELRTGQLMKLSVTWSLTVFVFNYFLLSWLGQVIIKVLLLFYHPQIIIPIG
jgi:hypothetical protein